jgi:hypothetical protein
VSKHNLCHNHQRDPLVFEHLCLSQEVGELIKVFGRMHCRPEPMADSLREDRHVQLSSYQVSAIMYHDRAPRVRAKTEELREFVAAIGGECFFQDRADDGQVLRSAVVSFTPAESRNLEEYGDIVAIDPTFVALNLNWSVIPLTLIGRHRELHSGGVVFCATTSAEVFTWILCLLVHPLPCRERLKTIISDDDQGLDAAFSQTRDASIRERGVLSASGIRCKGSCDWPIKVDALNSLTYSELWGQPVARASVVPASMT